MPRKILNNIIEYFLGGLKARRQPKFWEKRRHQSLWTDLLLPFSVMYYGIVLIRNRQIMPEKLKIPVICVGNVTLGGAGKTPLAIKIAAEIKKSSRKKAAFVLRGYLGREKGPAEVDAAKHNARDVGDEALLLARHAPVFIGHDRVAAAKLAIDRGAELIIMDDGFQNPSFEKDLSFIAIDGGFGIGNGMVLPAGPLREPLLKAMQRAAAVVFIGDDKNDIKPIIARYGRLIPAELKSTQGADFPNLVGRKIFAFAGIGRPQKFFDTLKYMGAEIIKQIPFPDHYFYEEQQINMIVMNAEAEGAIVITTEKDYVRLPQHLREKIKALPVELEILETTIFDQLLKPYL